MEFLSFVTQHSLFTLGGGLELCGTDHEVVYQSPQVARVAVVDGKIPRDQRSRLLQQSGISTGEEEVEKTMATIVTKLERQDV